MARKTQRARRGKSKAFTTTRSTDDHPIPRLLQSAMDRGLWVTAGAAVVTHLLHWVNVRLFDPLYAQTMPGNDTFTYLEWARDLVAGDWLGAASGSPFYYGPLYPYFLGVLFRVFGENFDVVHGVQALIGVLPPVLLWLVCNRLFGKGPALATGLLAAFCAPALFYEQLLLMEGLVLATHAGMLYALARGFDFQRRAGLWALVAGALSGLACWGRGNTLLVIVMLTAFWPIAARWVGPQPAVESQTGDADSIPSPLPGTRKRLVVGATCAMAYLLGAALLLGVTLWRNHYVSGRWVLVTTNGPVNLHMGNASDSLGVMHRPPSLEKLKKRYGSEEAVPWMRELLRDAAAHPGTFLGLQLKKTWMFWNSYEIADNRNYYANKRYSWLLRVSPVTWLTVLPLAVLGVWETRRSWRRQLFLYVYAFGFSLSIIAVFISGRFRLPEMLPMLIWAGVAVAGLARRVWERDWRRVIAWAGVWVAGVVCLWPGWSPGVRRNNPEGVSGVRLIGWSDYRRLAAAHVKLDEHKQARAILEEAVDRYPWVYQLVGFLATIYARDREPDKAASVLENHIRLVGKNPDATIKLAEMYALGRRYENARSVLRQLLQTSPENTRAKELLERLQGLQ